MQMSLYHNAMSTCSQKVRLALAEKYLTWTSIEIDLLTRQHKTESYLAINPEGVVPTLKVDDRVLVESSLINYFIDEACDGPSLMPVSALERYAARQWIRRVDDGVHTACGILTYATALRVIMLQMERGDVLADIATTKDPHARAVRLSLYEHGVEAPAFQDALRHLLGFMTVMDDALAKSHWLSGSDFGLADCAALPYVLRLDHLKLNKIWTGGRLPNLEAWLAAAQSRPSFETAVTHFLSAPALAMFEAVGSLVAPKLALT